MAARPRPSFPDEREALIREARERQLRRRLLAAAGVAIVAALALAIYALATSRDTSTGIGQPTGLGGMPRCRTSQISITFPMLVGVLSPGRNGLLVMTNKTNTACSLPLRPPRARITWRGTVLTARQEPGRGIVLASWQPLRTVRKLVPGQKAAVSFYWQNWCGRPRNYRPPFMTVHLRFDSVLAVSVPVGPHPFCAAPDKSSTIRVSRPLVVR
jgi:hypothetical protein